MSAARRRIAIALLALFALLFVVYAPAVDGPYLWDDHSLVERDEEAPAPLSQIVVSPFFVADPLVDGRPAYFRPLSTLSLRADSALLGTGPFGHHVVNILLHAIAAILLVLFALRLGAGPIAAVLAGTTWALAPRLTESVAWISGRPELLAGVFAFAALVVWPWMPGVEPPKDPTTRAGSSLGLLFFALLAKEIAVASVIALAVATLLAPGTRRERGRRAALLLAPPVLYGVLRTLALAHEPRRPLFATFSVGSVLEATGRYLTMVLDPWHPASSIGLVGEVDAKVAILGAVTLAAAVALAGWSWRRRAHGPALVAAALGLAGLAPVLRILPLGLASAVASDRLLYVPLAGLVVALAVLANRLSSRAQLPAAAIAASLAVSFAVTSRLRSDVYADELRFWLVAAEQAHPNNTAPRSVLANIVRDLGVPEVACKLHASVERLLSAGSRSGTQRHARAIENLASCDALIGHTDEAIALYRGLLTTRPDAGRTHMGLGFVQLQMMAFDEAEASFRRAVSLEPGLAIARSALLDLPKSRGLAMRLSTAEAREADPLGWARLMMRVGRVADADRAWLAIARDPAAPPEVFGEAVKGLLSTNDVASAQTVLARDTSESSFLRKLAGGRAAKQARVAAVSARLDALSAR